MAFPGQAVDILPDTPAVRMDLAAVEQALVEELLQSSTLAILRTPGALLRMVGMAALGAEMKTRPILPPTERTDPLEPCLSLP